MMMMMMMMIAVYVWVWNVVVVTFEMESIPAIWTGSRSIVIRFATNDNSTF